MDLLLLAQTYMEAEGYSVFQQGADLLIGTKDTPLGARESNYVWVPEVSGQLASRERPLLDRFAKVSDENPGANKFLLVPTTEGFSREFLVGASRWYGTDVRVPMQFFDTAFKWESASAKVSSASNDLRKRGEQRASSRIEQPFQETTGRARGNDLLEFLYNRFRRTDSKEGGVHVVIGPAGIGKTWLYETLFAKLYSAFQEDKRAWHQSSRPFPLIPDYLAASASPTSRALLGAYLKEDFGQTLSEGAFYWMLTNGFGVWLLDGLDELIAADPNFFDQFVELLHMPHATTKPKVLLCVRDSLFATNEALNDFCNEFDGNLEIYELQPWRDQAKERYARRALGPAAGQFLKHLHERPELNSLASLPYYCDVLTGEFAAGRLRRSYTPEQILERATREIIRREYSKGLLDSDVIREDDVLDFLEAIAWEDFHGGFAGVRPENAKRWAELVVPGEADPAASERLVANLTQLALFSSYQGLGRIQFDQEILEHYLLGRSLLRSLAEDPERLLDALRVRRISPDWVTLRMVVDRIRSEDRFQELTPLVYQATSNATALRNMLQLAALSANHPAALRDFALEGHDLTGLELERLDLRGVSFRRCDLTDVKFDACNLRGCNFDEARFKNTAFVNLGDDAMNSITVGTLANFYTIRVDDGGLIKDYKDAKSWFEHRTKGSIEVDEPCAWAQQLRFLFGKFVHPDGSPRRSWIDKYGMRAGKRHVSDVDAVIKAAEREGLLFHQTRPHERYMRPDGPEGEAAYAEMIDLVAEWKLGDRTESLLGRLCDKEGCEHVPKVAKAA